MASRHILVRQILKILGGYQAGQDLPAEDYQAVNEELPFHLLAMDKADVYSVPDPEHIPDEAVVKLSQYLAQFYITTFGLVAEERQKVENDALTAERDLRYQRTNKPTYSVMRGEFM